MSQCKISCEPHREWVKLPGLASCASSKLGKQCVEISQLGYGSHNTIYQLHFADSTVCAASITNWFPDFFFLQVKLSEIATMQYLRSSPLYDIPIPEVYAWDLTFGNPAGAPYVLRELVVGKNLAEGFYSLSSSDQVRAATALAHVQAELSKPSEFNRLGSIYHEISGGFCVGPLASATCGDDVGGEVALPSKGPYSSLAELWQARLERDTQCALSHWASSLDPVPEAHLREFGGAVTMLKQLTKIFTPPAELETLCIQHCDLAIRNVLFGDDFEIKGVIDWEYATVAPLACASRYPDPLGAEENESRASSLRSAYASCIASMNPAHANLLIDSAPYVEFHKIAVGGFEMWLENLEWIKDVFWGLTTLDADLVKQLRNGEKPLRVQEILRQKRPGYGALDLSDWEARVKNEVIKK